MRTQWSVALRLAEIVTNFVCPTVSVFSTGKSCGASTSSTMSGTVRFWNIPQSERRVTSLSHDHGRTTTALP